MIRDNLFAWPELVTTTTEALDTTELGVDLTAVDNLAGQDLIECESEVMTVRSVSSLTATVIRGARGTTAASHSSGVSVSIYPKWGWTDVNLNLKINTAIEWLGEGMCWVLEPHTNTWLADYKEFGLPDGCNYPTGNIVKMIEMKDGSGGDDTEDQWRPILGWKHQGDRIFLNENLDIDREVRLWIQTIQPRLSSDSTVIKADKFAEAIALYATSRCLDELVGNRARYYDYSVTLNDRAASSDELMRNSHGFYNQAVVLRNEMSRPGLSGLAAIQRGHV